MGGCWSCLSSKICGVYFDRGIVNGVVGYRLCGVLRMLMG